MCGFSVHRCKCSIFASKQDNDDGGDRSEFTVNDWELCVLSEMCGVDPVTEVVWLCHSASMKQVHVGVSNTFVFARQHRLWQIVTIIFFFFWHSMCLHYTVAMEL